ncbi:Sialic acid-binding Ig-like lectin 14 [Frankliniella fusca]|uniref:Sialic acid-binding Ig-like lectin 14 n=1 Tax=Frankliniella fusca TaxID=407009 RepID=A0AAE1I3L1_9NEOP|nr:Sialic acid-binding Ig-like lectin 14 [Frankliniella fusca]
MTSTAPQFSIPELPKRKEEEIHEGLRQRQHKRKEKLLIAASKAQGSENNRQWKRETESEDSADMDAYVAQEVTSSSEVERCFAVCFADSPSFDITRSPGFGVPIREGTPLSLKCDVDSNPPSSPVWQKGINDMSPPVEQAGDGYLNFSAVRREHAGWYKCSCRHLLTEYSSNAYLLQVRVLPWKTKYVQVFIIG